MMQRLLHHSSSSPKVLLLLNTPPKSTGNSSSNVSFWKWKQQVDFTAIKGGHEQLEQYYKGTCGLRCAVQPKEQGHEGCTKQQVWAKLHRLASESETRLLVLHYIGPADGHGNPTFPNQDVLTFKEVTEQWQQMRVNPAQHLLVVLDCPGSHQWVDQLARLPTSARQLLGLAIQALECTTPAPPGAVSAWFVQQQCSLLGASCKASQPTPDLPADSTMQCSYCTWCDVTPAQLKLPWVFMPADKCQSVGERTGDQVYTQQAGEVLQGGPSATGSLAALSNKRRPSLDQSLWHKAQSIGRILKPMLSLPARGVVLPASQPTADHQSSASLQAADSGIPAVRTESRQQAWSGTELVSAAQEKAEEPDKLQTSQTTIKAAETAVEAVDDKTDEGPVAQAGADNESTPSSQVFQQRLLVELRKEESQRMRRGRRGGLGGDEPFHELLNPAADDGMVSRSHSSALPLVHPDSTAPSSPDSPVAAFCHAACDSPNGMTSSRGVGAQLLNSRQKLPEASRLAHASRAQDHDDSPQQSLPLPVLPSNNSDHSLPLDMLALVPASARDSMAASEQGVAMQIVQKTDQTGSKARDSSVEVCLPPVAKLALLQALRSNTGQPLVIAASPALLHSVLSGNSSVSAGLPKGDPTRRSIGGHSTAVPARARAPSLFSQDNARWAYLQSLVSDAPQLQQELTQLLPPNMVPSNSSPINSAPTFPEQHVSSIMLTGSISQEVRPLNLADDDASGPLVDAMVATDALVGLIQALQSSTGRSLAETASPALLMHLIEASDSCRGNQPAAADRSSEDTTRPRRAAMDGSNADDIFANDAERWQYLQSLVAGDPALEQEMASLQPNAAQAAAHEVQPRQLSY